MGWVVNATPRPLYPRERTSTRCIGGWVDPGPVWTGGEFDPRPSNPTELSRPLNMHVDVSKFERSHECLQTCTKYANINISKHNGMEPIRLNITMFHDVVIQNTRLLYVIRYHTFKEPFTLSFFFSLHMSCSDFVVPPSGCGCSVADF
jgi:hypothetical protein